MQGSPRCPLAPETVVGAQLLGSCHGAERRPCCALCLRHLLGLIRLQRWECNTGKLLGPGHLLSLRLCAAVAALALCKLQMQLGRGTAIWRRGVLRLCAGSYPRHLSLLLCQRLHMLQRLLGCTHCGV